MRRRAIVALLALAACGGDPRAPAAVAVRDSAGVRIVESLGRAWDSTSAWRLAPAPVAAIGADADDPAHALSFVNGVRRLSDGTLVVADNGTRELRVFDAAGRLVRTIGRSGEGPGEFRSLGQLYRCAGDTLVARDFQRLQVVTRDGSFARAVSPQALLGGGYRDYQGVSADCARLLVVARERRPADAPPETPQRHVLLWTDPLGERADTVAAHRGPDVLAIQVMGRATVVPQPWGATPSHALGPDDALHVGRGDTAEVRTYDAAGRLRRIVRWAAEPSPVTDADRRLFAERHAAFVRRFPDERPIMGAVGRTPRAPGAKPYFTSLLADDRGHLWVRTYPAESTGWPQIVDFEPDPAADWLVFDPDGRLLGTVRTPAGLRVIEVVDGHVVGVWRDADDVEHVHVYRLVVPGA